MPAKLVVLAGPRCGDTVSIDSAETSIGRDVRNYFNISDHLMSRRHCVVELSDGRCTLRDLGSANGTYVNGMPVRERTLSHGDRIRVGDSVLLFLQAGMDTPQSAAETNTAETIDDRTQRIARANVTAAAAEPPPGSPDAIVAEGLAGRMTLQAHDMVGESAPMRAVYECIQKVAPRDSTVLVTGETGTGKELAARAIHQNSPRAARPFVAVNCAALTESLLESELFGHEKGAFTGAIALKKGRFELAEGGTIFLDEVGELAMPLQAKLLRVLQQREFERVGGTQVHSLDIRVIAATNRDLQEDVREGKFREDLLYRLNVVTLESPPLREHKEDIPVLARYFLERSARRCKRQVEGLSKEAEEILMQYSWPGNVRELENAMERAVVLGVSDTVLPEDLPEAMLESAPRESGAKYHSSLGQAKREAILDAYVQGNGDYKQAARLLGLHPNYLLRLVRNLNLRDEINRRMGE